MRRFLYTHARADTHRTNLLNNIHTRMINKQLSFTAVQRLILIGLVVLLAAPMNARSSYGRGGMDAYGNYHFGYISGTVGYSMLHTNITSALPQGNLGGAAGIGYEFRNSGLWASVGIQLSFHRSSLIIDEYNTRNEPDQTPYRGYDTQGHKTTFHYRVNQVDELQWNFLDVPLMFGYYVKGFHFGAGIKVSYALNPYSRTKGTYNLSATNDNYDVTFEDMPDRGYTDYAFDQTYQNRLNVGVGLLGEIGYDLLSKARQSGGMNHILKLSFYVEYGLNNHLRDWDSAEKRVAPNPDNMRNASIYPYLNTFAHPTRTVPFYTGIKLTYLIGGNPNIKYSSSHTGCMCYQND